MNKIAFITGVTGQDGACLSEFLLKKGYTVHGLKRRTSLFNTDRIDHLYEDPHIENQKFILHHGDMTIIIISHNEKVLSFCDSIINLWSKYSNI